MNTNPEIKIVKVLAFILLFVGLTSCGKNTVYKEYVDIPSGVWANDNLLEYTFNIEDASQLYEVDIMLRNASLYPYSNIWIFIHQTAPDGSEVVDTLECVLADKEGKWLGDGMGDLWDNEIPWRLNYSFPQTGEYTYRIEHGMRLEHLPGIMDVGLSIKIQE